MSDSHFSAVVVIHDSARELGLLLESIDEHLPHRPQVIVVDSGSRDGGASIARAWGAEVLELEENLGFGAANNAGVRIAATDACVLINPDVVLLDDGLLRLVALARERESLIVPRLLEISGRLQRSAHPLPGTIEALLPALVHPRALPKQLRLRADPWRAERPRRVGWAIAACVGARTELLRRLGPFDPSVFLFYEDMDLCLRARAAGVPTELRPEVSMCHAGAHSTRPKFDGEPYELLARRRREVVGARLGSRALALDDAAQALTFATRVATRRVIGKETRRPRDQLRALVRARTAGTRRHPTSRLSRLSRP
jgi:N-acetylglucosaminyl-diphospho-decaprenol L-rhamnosyltransferase